MTLQSPVQQPVDPAVAYAAVTAKPDPDAAPAHFSADAIVAMMPALRIYARSLTMNRFEADDLVQEALIRAIEKADQFQPGTNLRAWIFTILRNCFYSAYAKRRRESAGSDDCVAGQAIGSADAQMWHLAACEFNTALMELPLPYREALILVTVSGASYIEAADILNCEIGTVKSRIHRARSRLKEQLGDLFG